MEQTITIGLDLAKQVFQVHGVDAAGAVTIRRQLRRSELLGFFRGLSPCLVGMEACGSAHHWARAIAALGHQVRLVAPSRVKPYVKPGKKNDAADAAAICEAVTRPRMRFVPVKSPAQQGMLLLHRGRDLLVRQRTMLINALRGHLAEFGLIAGQGKGNFAKLLASLEGEAGQVSADLGLPAPALRALRLLAAQIEDANAKIEALEKEIVAQHRDNEASRELATIPGFGPIIATAMAATVTDAAAFESGRGLAAWIGLVPRQHSTGGKQRLGGITKAGDRYLRRLLVIGATGLIRYRRANVPGGLAWLQGMLARKPVRVVIVALANKMARIAWAILRRGGIYREVAAMPATVPAR